MPNPRWSDVAPKRGNGKYEAIHTTQKGPGKGGSPEKHGGATDGPSEGSMPTNAKLSGESMCGFGEKKSKKGIGGATTRGF